MSKRKIIISWLPIYLFYRTSCKLKVSSSCSIDCRITLNLSLLKTYIAANDFYIDHFIEASTRLNWNLDGHRSALSSNVRSPERLKMKEKNMDSGLVVVVLIITSLVITVFSFLLFVDYEWCHVLFKNNTVRYFYLFFTHFICCHKVKLDLNRKVNRHFSKMHERNITHYMLQELHELDDWFHLKLELNIKAFTFCHWLV